MAHLIQKPFLPLYRLAHWPPGVAYLHQQRQWMLDQVLANATVSGVRTALEIGCGDGWLCGQLAKHFQCRVVGFDYNPNRIGSSKDKRALLVAGDASRPPIADHSIDLILSLAVLEHLSDREAVLRHTARLLTPRGQMIHIVPMFMWKVLQWAGFVPDVARKQVRGLTRAAAGQRTKRVSKYHQGHETNNPKRASRRRWHQKCLPRVHGEYDSNLQELLEWTDSRWRVQFDAAGLRVIKAIPLGMSSPYSFGGFAITKNISSLNLASMAAYVLENA